MRVGRNETCPCGSGKKFKSCCEGKRVVPKGLLLLLALFVALAALAFVPRGEDRPSTSTASLPAAAPAPAAKPGPQPGPAPPGKVWSTEHGHWHDAGAPMTAPANSIKVEQTSNTPLTPTVAPMNTPVGPKPQPDGPVPPGKVWSEKHGHWHDKP